MDEHRRLSLEEAALEYPLQRVRSFWIFCSSFYQLAQEERGANATYFPGDCTENRIGKTLERERVPKYTIV